MTLTLYNAARSLQLLGLLGAVLGVGFVLLAPRCGSAAWTQAGAVGIVFDLLAVRVRRGSAAIPSSLLKLVVVGGSVMVGYSCAYVVTPPPPVPADLGIAVLLGSIVPSVVGAILLRFAR